MPALERQRALPVYATTGRQPALFRLLPFKRLFPPVPSDFTGAVDGQPALLNRHYRGQPAILNRHNLGTTTAKTMSIPNKIVKTAHPPTRRTSTPFSRPRVKRKQTASGTSYISRSTSQKPPFPLCDAVCLPHPPPPGHAPPVPQPLTLPTVHYPSLPTTLPSFTLPPPSPRSYPIA